MAVMIPESPKDFDAKSEENLVFEALKKLPDDYFVFHSFHTTVVDDKGVIRERECDFVIANAKKGILCIEAKNGKGIKYDGRKWLYSSGKKMDKDGPYNQCATAKRNVIDKIKYHANEEVQELYKKCKIMHSVWFFKVPRVQFEDMEKKGLPEDCDSAITLLAEDLINPTKKIAEIFALKRPSQTKYSAEETKLTDEEFELLMDSVLCPHFNIIPSPAADKVIASMQLTQLLEEQFHILDYLRYQPSAIINGAAGTGKTMIAAEKARQHSIEGEKVLFLCFNRMLCDYLIATRKNNSIKATRKQYENVDFMTISKLAKEKTGNFKDYDGLLCWVEDCYGDIDKFGYKHVIIDEGQDFGLVDSELGNTKIIAKSNCSIIDSIKDVVLDAGGTFYLFYDKYQMIQGQEQADYELLDCIQDCDCKLTLYCNCRNTKEIAKTSVTPLRDNKNRAIKPITAYSRFEPIRPTMHIIHDNNSVYDVLDTILNNYAEADLDNVVILTIGTLEYCSIGDVLVKDEKTGSYYYEHRGNRHLVTTCKKFKGLEADAIILIDLNKESFFGKRGLEFYVGTSRAKFRLDLICKMEKADFAEVVHELDPNAPNTPDDIIMKRILGNTFSSDIVEE